MVKEPTLLNDIRDMIKRSPLHESVRKIQAPSIPKVPAIYSNGDFKTHIYKAGDDAPCLDRIFYNYEHLIPYGKEYWFAIFSSLDGKKPMQLVSAFGRRNSRRAAMDDIEVNGKTPDSGPLNTGAFAWCYDGKKKLAIPAVETKTVFSPDSITCAGDKLSMTISGTAPAYRVVIDSKKIKCDFNVRKPSSGYDEEVLNETKMGLNYQVYNLYYNFDGMLNGKDYSGRCYLQKVILSTPLVPWYWARLVFKDGSFFVFFNPHVGNKDIKYPVRNKGIFYSASHDRLFWVYDIKVEHDLLRSNWKFTSEGKDYSLNMSVKSYSHHRFKFRLGGKFTYDEYMVKANQFEFHSADVRADTRSLGTGVGMVEEATGILI
jgi:hypothetical protein